MSDDSAAILNELRRIRQLEEERLELERYRAREACPRGGEHDWDIRDIGAPHERRLRMASVCTKCGQTNPL